MDTEHKTCTCNNHVPADVDGGQEQGGCTCTDKACLCRENAGMPANDHVCTCGNKRADEHRADEFPVVHLWPNYAFHESGYIIGNREGLIKLRECIDRALSDELPRDSKTELFVSDGEGYTLYVSIDENTDTMAVPYVADYAEETRDNVVYPWDMISIATRDGE